MGGTNSKQLHADDTQVYAGYAIETAILIRQVFYLVPDRKPA